MKALTRASPGIFLPNQLRVMLWFSKPLMKAFTRAPPDISLPSLRREILSFFKKKSFHNNVLGFFLPSLSKPQNESFNTGIARYLFTQSTMVMQ